MSNTYPDQINQLDNQVETARTTTSDCITTIVVSLTCFSFPGSIFCLLRNVKTQNNKFKNRNRGKVVVYSSAPAYMR